MNLNSNTIIAAVMALFLVAGGAIAAVPSNDTETSTTTTVSDIQSGDLVTLNATEDSTHRLEADSMTADGEVQLLDADGNVLYSEGVEASSSSGYFYANVTADEMRGNLDIVDDENTTYTVKYVNDTTVDSPDISNFTFDLQGDNFSVETISDFDANESNENAIATLSTEERFFGLLDDRKSADLEFDHTLGSDTDSLTVNLADSELNTRFADLVESDSESASPMPFLSLSVDGEQVPIYNGEAPEDLEETTYAVYDSGSLSINFSDDMDDGETIDVAASNTDMGNIYDVYKVYGFDGLLASF